VPPSVDPALGEISVTDIGGTDIGGTTKYV